MYTACDVAYVGGGFHDAGLHSVLEPAAASVPVAFGPRHGNARAAGRLLAQEGAKEVGDSAALAEVLSFWLGDESARRYSGERAYAYIEQHMGAARRSAAHLDDLLPR
jgi:3-deoxy-D-manno-octulosonic-acid transferase